MFLSQVSSRKRIFEAEKKEEEEKPHKRWVRLPPLVKPKERPTYKHIKFITSSSCTRLMNQFEPQIEFIQDKSYIFLDGVYRPIDCEPCAWTPILWTVKYGSAEAAVIPCPVCSEPVNLNDVFNEHSHSSSVFHLNQPVVYSPRDGNILPFKVNKDRLAWRYSNCTGSNYLLVDRNFKTVFEGIRPFSPGDFFAIDDFDNVIIYSLSENAIQFFRPDGTEFSRQYEMPREFHRPLYGLSMKIDNAEKILWVAAHDRLKGKEEWKDTILYTFSFD